MAIVRAEQIELRVEEEMVQVRQIARRYANELGFSLVEQTKIVTAVSELARNTLYHGGGGCAEFQMVEEAGKRGLRAIFTDQGPGIANLDQALCDGFTTGDGLGLGLGGAKRLVNEFEIDSRPGEGTRVEVTRWQ